MVNPCPCTSLQRGASILAIIDAIEGVLLVLQGIFVLLGVGFHETDDTETKTAVMVLTILFIIIAICGLALALYLRKSARLYKYEGCKRWLIITAILFTIGVISTVANLFSTGISAVNLTLSIIGILYRLYVMFVVFSLMKEIKENKGAPNTPINGGGVASL